MKKTQINEEVVVTALGFRKNKNLVVYPRRIEFRGTSYDFIDAGLRCLVNCGGKIAEIITLSDGRSDYCLRRDDSIWTLLSIAS